MSAKKRAECFQCPALNKQETEALKALGKGEADEFQQTLALAVIVKKFSMGPGMTYVPDSFDQSSFLSGRAFVGQKILRILNVPIARLIQQQEEDSDEIS
jgi:hypothetical protein